MILTLRKNTWHRSIFDSTKDDENFELALEYGDTVAHRVYREEAKAIDDIHEGILEVSGKEGPYDNYLLQTRNLSSCDEVISLTGKEQVMLPMFSMIPGKAG